MLLEMRRLAVAVCMLALAGCSRARGPLRPAPDAVALRADGYSSATVTLDAPGASVYVVEGARRVRVEAAATEGACTRVLLRAGVLPGRAAIEVRAPGRAPARIPIQLSPDPSDRDRDGTPDVLLLTDEGDRAAFLDWFTFLAEAQYGNPALPAGIDDCAALVRYAYREALSEHSSEQARSLRLPQLPASGGVRKYQFPFTPLGPNLFRTASGFAQFADAETLMRMNAWPVSRDVARARPGDLLFFRQLDQSMPFHVMIYVGPSRIDPASGPVVVYHTGPAGKLPGEVRRLTVPELLAHPLPRWRPLSGNPNFLGVFRWNILKDS